MADTKDIEPAILEMFDLENPYTIDQSFGTQIYSPTGPRGSASAPVLSYDISRDPNRLVDLANSYINIDLTIKLPDTVAMTPNMQLALSNNGLMYLFSKVQLQINGTTVEEITNDPGTITTLQNLLWYSKEYSQSPNALTDNCWQIDDHSFFTTLSGGKARCPNQPITSQAQAATLSSGMANSVNGIKNQVNMPVAGALNAYATDDKFVDTLGPNKKFSSGFKARHDILFNQLAGTNDNALNIAYDGATNTVKVVFKLMLSHIFMTLKTCNKVFRGGQILITLNKDTANIYKAFNIDRTPRPATGDFNKTAIQTWPTSQGILASGWSQNFSNVTSPWVDMSDPAGNYKMGNFSITWNDAMLYLRVVQPKYSIYSKIIDAYVPDDKPVFYDAITTVGTYQGLSTASQQTLQLGTTLANADYLIFAFQVNQGNTPITETAYVASVDGVPGTFIGASNGSRTTDGASNYAVFDSLNLQRSYLSYGSTNYPTTQIDSDWFSAHNSNLNVKLIQQLRKEYFAIEDGRESSPIIDSQNWLNLYPLYTIDLRPKQSTVVDNPSVPSTNQLQLTFNGPIPAGATMYYLFLGHRSFKMNNMTTEIVY